MIEDSRCQWEDRPVFMKSLDCQVPANWVTREIKLKASLKKKLEVFPIAEDHLIVRFKEEAKCALVLRGGS